MKSVLLLGAMLGVFFSASNALAGNLTTLAPSCVGATLDVYTASTPAGSFVCSVGILNFTSFSFSATGTAANPLATDQIFLNPCEVLALTTCADSTGNGLSGGFTFSATNGGTFGVASGEVETYEIDWTAIIDAGPIMMSADMGMDPPSGNVNITEKYCGDGNTDGPNFCSTLFQTLTVSDPPCTDPVNNPLSCTTSLNFSPPIQVQAHVVTLITLNGASGASSFDSFTTVADVVGTPEPATAIIGLGGLLAIGFFGRRRRVE